METLESDTFKIWPEPGLGACLGTTLGLGILRESGVSYEGRNKMSDPVKRTERWLVKYNLERVNKTLADLQGKMAEHYTAAMVGLCAMETEVKAVINAAGVSTSQYVPYLNFGRQLYKLSRQRGISGESFAMAAQVLLDKWAARGCDPKVLAKIRKDVFDVEAPKP
jgi:hypothetical protein